MKRPGSTGPGARGGCRWESTTASWSEEYYLPREEGSNLHAAFLHAAKALAPRRYDEVKVKVRAAVVVPDSADWRNELLAILHGRDVDNQAIGFKATRT